MGLSYTQDLENVDMAIVGIPFDSGGAIRSGGRFGPGSIREQSKLYLRPYHRVLGFSPFDILNVVDYGNLSVVQESIELSYKSISNDISYIINAGVLPFVFGGDHGISLPLLRAIASRHGPMALVHFDAHQDIVDSYYNGLIRYNNGTVFRRAVDEGLVDPTNSIQVGMNGTVFPGMFQEESEKLGFQVLPIEKVVELGPVETAKVICKVVSEKKVYLSFDIDVMDVSVAPGSGAPEVGGLMPREAVTIIRGLAPLNIYGIDLVEVNPLFDVGHITSILAANLAFELIGAVAARFHRCKPAVIS